MAEERPHEGSSVVDDNVRDWFRARGVMIDHVPAIRGTLVFEPTIRLFGQPNLRDCRIGAYSYVAPQTTMNQTTVGRYCSIGDRVTIGPTEHPSNWLTTSPVSYKDVFDSGKAPSALHNELADVKIGNDVWIGATAAIMGGVTVGDGAMIAYGSVVTKDVAPYSIVGGVPARPIRNRFGDDTIEALLASQWWRIDLVNLQGSGISWDQPLRAIVDVERMVAAGSARLIPLSVHRIHASGDGRFSFDRIETADR